MLRLLTEVNCKALPVQCSLQDRILLLGSCFADEIGSKMLAAGFNVCVNPFGTLYNPASIASAVRRLDGNDMFCESDCVQMGAGSTRICSFEHHTSFARDTAEDFLRDANEALAKARAAWRAADRVIITLGTARVWEHCSAGVVSNCLKRDGREFRSRMLAVEDCGKLLRDIVGAHPEKEFIFTVSPIRHMGEGAHDNTLSKATLHLALESIRATYFPACEILCDELRDYRFYGADLVHPSDLAVEIIWERFLQCAVPVSDHKAIAENLKTYKSTLHRSSF